VQQDAKIYYYDAAIYVLFDYTDDIYILFQMPQFLLNVLIQYNKSVGKSIMKSASHDFFGLSIFPQEIEYYIM
jgi:hypothetical protein